MRKTHLLGLLLWRGGMLLIAATVLFEGAWWFLRYFDLTLELRIGLGLVLAGLVMVVVSLICERVVDARAEGDLLE